ncbi:MAG TPA: YidB family protein [Candidatus Methylacidiphilales bacterium]|jgi:uncharacterized protein YidB (DUF937 family)|nr:YidB family protein [Candidatus Methylacidiphilales bacterium]
MGLFDTILGGLEAKDTQHAALYAEVGNLVNQAGGVSGLTQQFQQKGLGGVISGWVSNGPNPAISGEQIIDVIGKDKVAAIAAKAGLTEDQVAAGVSKLLPLVVDHLTPNGTVPPHSPADVNAALGVPKQKLLG